MYSFKFSGKFSAINTSFEFSNTSFEFSNTSFEFSNTSFEFSTSSRLNWIWVRFYKEQNFFVSRLFTFFCLSSTTKNSWVNSIKRRIVNYNSFRFFIVHKCGTKLTLIGEKFELNFFCTFD